MNDSECLSYNIRAGKQINAAVTKALVQPKIKPNHHSLTLILLQTQKKIFRGMFMLLFPINMNGAKCTVQVKRVNCLLFLSLLKPLCKEQTEI